jgi:predicted acetyltransferase
LNFQLLKPHVKYKDSFLTGLAEMPSESDMKSWIYLGDAESLETPALDFNAYVDRLLFYETHAPEHFVRSVVYWAIAGNEIVGRIAIRPELNNFLRRAGGHIGYIVRPSYRQQGVATEMLRQLLEMDKVRALGKLLVTCDEDNVASEKAILKNGGVLENILEMENRPRKKRFWITL